MHVIMQWWWKIF